MTDLEQLLSAGPEVRLQKRDAQEILQKLRARGAESEAADRLESRLAQGDEVVIPSGEAQQLLEALRASGRRWISGTGEPREQPPPEPEPEAEPEPTKRRWFWQRG
ncbi:MAG: hypothetical protein E6F97_12280 [Actinobacteria bacterium]|nr:MAG: hypothetical protein E6F97_12280 [Actinomycetota bacterium]